MNSSSPERIATEIRNLFDSLNQHNYESVVNQLLPYTEHGIEESVLLCEACFEHSVLHHIEYGIEESVLLGEASFDYFASYISDLNSTYLEEAISTLFRKLMEKTHFSVVFTSLLRDTSVSEEFLDNVSCAMQLSGCDKLGFGLALLDSENNDVRIAGRNFCMSWCEDLCAAHNSWNTAEYIQKVLRFLEKSEVLSKHTDSFREMILQIFEPQSVFTPSITMASSPDFATSSQAVNSASRETPIEAPSLKTLEMISLIINNLTDDNIEAKAKDFTANLAERYYPWFAQYLVMKRVSLQPDLHTLYIDFVARTSSKQLNKEIVKASYEICKVLLSSEFLKSSMEGSRLLENLGGWLGKLIIGRNQALLAKHIDPKSLLLNAYEKGLLIGVIPFIAKIMEPCESSVAYKPPNVWTMAILELLAEIYATENLLEKLKQEIEVLFNTLEVDITLITKTSLLKDMSSQQEIVQEVNSSVNQDESPFAANGPSYQGVHVSQDLPVVDTEDSSQVDLSAVNDAKEAEIQIEQVINHPEASSSSCRDENRTSEAFDPDFREQVSMLLAEWCYIRHHPGKNSDAACAQYVLQLHQNVLSKADDMPDRFFHLLLELVISEIDLSPLKFRPPKHPSPFLFIDIYEDFIFSILKFYPDDEGSSKLFLLLTVLAVIVRFITENAKEKKASGGSYKDSLFIQKKLSRPMLYKRLFINFFVHLSTLESVIKDGNFQILKAISVSFHALRPLKVSTFRYQLLSLVSHKDFMPKLLTEDGQKGWPFFHRLLMDFLEFLEPLLRTGPLTEPVRGLEFYKGILKVVLVLIHDFPEFICYYHFSLCDVIGPRCIQLRNMILSASPRNIKIPDPKTTMLKVDLLPETSQSPCISYNFDAALKSNNMQSDLDEYLNTKPAESSFLSELKHKLRLSSYEAEKSGTCYNVPLINSLVLYVGTKAIEQMPASSIPGATTGSRCVEAALNIFQTIILDLDSEGRYYFFNAVANQLRYPNSHTHYFAFIMLYFYTEIKLETVQEQITRILLERMISKSPRPWGALVTFLELVKNPRYNFSKVKFTDCDHLKKKCLMMLKSPDETVVLLMQ